MRTLIIVGLAIALIVFFPFAVIWAANTLFPVLAIPATFDTWLAIVILGMFFRGEASFKA